LPAPPRRPEDAAQIAELVARLQRQSRELADAQSELLHVRAERDRLRSTLSEQGSALEGRARAEELRERDHAATVAALRAQVAEQERRLSSLRELEARVDELEGQALEVAGLRAANRELEARLSALPPPAEPLRGKRGAPVNGKDLGDDLKRIRGIGPAFERALKARGVTTFGQIAGWSATEMEETARALRVKIERIRREDWVGGARALLAGSEKS
jgi:predicted flap endonuclease-1-like 5' DNA nuclease